MSTQEGAWLVYGHDMNPYPIALFADAEQLARWLEDRGGGWELVTFWPFGTTFAERKNA